MPSFPWELVQGLNVDLRGLGYQGFAGRIVAALTSVRCSDDNENRHDFKFELPPAVICRVLFGTMKTSSKRRSPKTLSSKGAKSS